MFRRSIWTVALVSVRIVGCGAIQEYSKLHTPVDRTLRAGVGQAVFRIQKSRDLPNVYGKADIFGRKVDTGYRELRYLGMADASTLAFVFHEQEIYSNETTMLRTGVAPPVLNTTGSGVVGAVPVAPSATTQLLAPYDVPFKHNFVQSPVFEHSGVRITIIKATPSELTYSLSQAEK